MSESLWPIGQDQRLLTQLAHLPPEMDLPNAWLAQLESVWLPLACWLASLRIQAQRPIIVGIQGGQGSGKSTLSQAMAHWFHRAFDWNLAVLSLDDLYLSHQQRKQLAQDIHPLLATRGVPGTHDMCTGLRLLQQLPSLAQGESIQAPAFDKISDDVLPPSAWHTFTGPIDMLLFEGWCVGCPAQSASQLQPAVNELEQQEDSDGRWRQWVNQQLDGHYQQCFQQLDYLISLQVPDMQAVYQWRWQQEQQNRQQSHTPCDRSFDEKQLHRFIQHYQRLTQHAAHTMPERADLVLQLNHAHQVQHIQLTSEAV